MMHLPASVRVYLCASACDMRKSFYGLHALVTQSMELDAFAGFCSSFTTTVPVGPLGATDGVTTEPFVTK
jgi:hypothetical protein